MVLRFGRMAGLAVICLTCVFSGEVDGQGTATGWVVADQGDFASDIMPGENSTQVFAGAGSLTTTNSSFSPDGVVEAQSSFPEVKLKVDSNSLLTGQVAYGGAYFEDSLTVLGGVGSFEMSMRWSFDGGVSGQGGEYWIGNDPGIGSQTGSAAANFRVYLDGFGQGNLDLSDPDLFKDVALEPSGALEVPYFDPFDESGSMLELPGFNSVSNFVFDQFEDGEPTGEFIEAWYTDTNADSLAFIGGGATFTWEYGVPLEFGVLLEGWAADGGVVDFSNTGTFTGLVIPNGASVVSAGGGSYNITTVPEPAAATTLLVGLVGVCLRRRRSVV